MITRLTPGRIAILSLSLVPTLISHGHARSRALNTPSIATPANFPQAEYQKIRTVLEQTDCKYLGGESLNSELGCSGAA
jgi:hypothetical protein